MSGLLLRQVSVTLLDLLIRNGAGLRQGDAHIFGEQDIELRVTSVVAGGQIVQNFFPVSHRACMAATRPVPPLPVSWGIEAVEVAVGELGAAVVVAPQAVNAAVARARDIRTNSPLSAF